MKYALIFPGNLALYFISLDIFEQICDEYNIDVYILYSKTNNYIHTMFNGNKTIDLTIDDFNVINNKLSKHIKYFKAIEDIHNYDEIINEHINAFQNKIKWTKELDTLDNFAYDSFMNNNRTKKYLDQFVRIKYLYNIIEENNINYDYIIRARIDQYIDYNLLKSMFDILNTNTQIYSIINCNMDNFFIVGKTHYEFFNYIANNIGSENLSYINKKDSYILGPEYQFNSLVKTFFKNITYFSNFGKHFEITFGILDIVNNCILIYRSFYTKGMCFGKYIGNNNINSTNYLEKLKTDKNITCKDIQFIDLPKKYYDINIPIIFYTLIL